MEGVNPPPPEEVPPTLHDNDMLPPLSSVVRKGYKIPFVNKPFLSPTPVLLQQTESLTLVEEVNKLLHKGAVEKIEPEGPGFYSRIFLVPKKNGKLRLIIDLSRLNTFLDIQSFRMETANKVRQAIQPNDWAFSLDLTCLSTCSYSPAVSEVSPFLSQGSGLSIKGSSIWPCDKSLCFHPFDGCQSNISMEKGSCTVSIFGRLVGQKSGSSRNSERPTVYKRTDYVPRTDNQQEKSDLVPSQNFVFTGMEFLTHKNIV